MLDISAFGASWTTIVFAVVFVFLFMDAVHGYSYSKLLHQFVTSGSNSEVPWPWWDTDLECKAPPSKRPGVALCAVCNQHAPHRCGGCKASRYCSREHQQQHWAAGHKRLCRKLALGLAAGLHVRTEGTAQQLDGNGKDEAGDAQKGASVHAHRLVPSTMVCPYNEFLALWSAAEGSSEPPTGLVNLGNSCFANAALQCLVATRPMSAYLCSGLHSSRGCPAPAGAFCPLCQLETLARRMRDGDRPANAQPFISHVRLLCRDMIVGEQEDTSEFLNGLLTALEHVMLHQAGSPAKLDNRSKETTLVHHVFGGYERMQNVCTVCGTVSASFDPFSVLSVEIDEDIATIEDALARYTQTEVLSGDNAYSCEKCKQDVEAERRLCFEVAPNTLQICLKRFVSVHGVPLKNSQMVQFGERLDLARFMAPNALDGGTAVYHLYGIIVHEGMHNSPHFGHYVAYVRGADGQWWECNDAQVYSCSVGYVLSRRAYMLFYTRHTPRPSLPDLARLASRAAAAAAASTSPPSPVQNGFGPGHGPGVPGAGKADIPSSSQAQPEVPRGAFAGGSVACSSRGFQPLHPTVAADAASLLSLEAGPGPGSRPPACTGSASSPEQQAAASKQSPSASTTSQGPSNDAAASEVAAGHLASRLSEMVVSRDEATLDCSAAGDASTNPAEGTVQPEVGPGSSGAVVHQSAVWGSGSGAAVDGLREGSPCRTGTPIDVRGPLQSQIAKSH